MKFLNVKTLGGDLEWYSGNNDYSHGGFAKKGLGYVLPKIENVDFKVLKQDGFMLFADALPQGHAIKFILIDDKGNIRKYFDGTDDASIAILKKDITQLVKQIRSI